MKNSLVKIFGILMFAGVIAVPSGPANALFIGFSSPLSFGSSGGLVDTLAIDFDASTHVQSAYSGSTANNVWITGGGAINIAAGVELSATLTIEIGPDPTFFPLTAVFEDTSRSLSAEIFLDPALSTSFTSQTYNLTLPFSPQASGYDLYFGLKSIPGDNVDISRITLDLEQTEEATGQISAPSAAAILGLSMIFIFLVRRRHR